MWQLTTNFEFMSMMISISGLIYIVSGLQYWTIDYMTCVLKLDPAIASAFFSVVCFSAPITGTVCGGAIVSYLGGYKAKSV